MNESRPLPDGAHIREGSRGEIRTGEGHDFEQIGMLGGQSYRCKNCDLEWNIFGTWNGVGNWWQCWGK